MATSINYPVALDTTGVTAGSTVVLVPSVQATGALHTYGLITSTQAFELYFEISPDFGVTYTQAKKIVSTAGPDATYTQCVEISQYCPGFYRITAKNTSASTSNFRADIRNFEIFAH